MNIVITNNPMVRDKANMPAGLYKIEFFDTDYLGVLKTARDKVHLGHALLTHPLSGSVKPGETPYKTVIVSGDTGQLDEKALSIIEESIQTCLKLATGGGAGKAVREDLLADFQLVDYSLVF
ncbi:MAG: GrdX family protein [Spirochaetes bacterium]|nr:GrdX family protein [Spirochaetota bacterium]